MSVAAAVATRAGAGRFGRPALVLRSAQARRRNCSQIGLLAALVALTGIITPLAAQQKVPLVLHHLVLAIDSATWNDVAKSPFVLEQFAATQISDYLNPPDAGGPGIRIMGRYNYLQLMSTSSVPYSGIVLAVERPDGLAVLRVQGSFRASPLTSVRDHTTSRGVNVVELADRITPAGIDSISDHVGFDILQYSAEAARIKSRVDSLPETRLSSSRFLAGYLDSRKLLSHLTGATIAIPVNEISKIVAVLKRDNVNVVSEGEGATIKLDGFTLHLIPPYRGAGVKQLQFALTHAAAANPTYRFGPKSQLRFGPGLIAVWDFEIK